MKLIILALVAIRTALIMIVVSVIAIIVICLSEAISALVRLFNWPMSWWQRRGAR
jgi:uncharacterized membrane protein